MINLDYPQEPYLINDTLEGNSNFPNNNEIDDGRKISVV